MPTIHIVDNHAGLRREIAKNLHARIQRYDSPTIRSDWRFIWQLFDTGREPMKVSEDVKAGDIAICDLYPPNYWTKVPGSKLYQPRHPTTDDAECIVLGSLDLIQRFLRPLHQSAYVIVITYVPKWLEKESKSDDAEFVKNQLEIECGEGRIGGVFYKADQTVNLDNYSAALDEVTNHLAVK